MDKDLFGMLQQQDLKQVHLVEQLVDTKTLQQDLQYLIIVQLHIDLLHTMEQLIIQQFI